MVKKRIFIFTFIIAVFILFATYFKPRFNEGRCKKYADAEYSKIYGHPPVGSSFEIGQGVLKDWLPIYNKCLEN